MPALRWSPRLLTSPCLPPRPPHSRVSSSAILGFLDAPALEAALAPIIPDAADRRFLVRCVTAEGPAHHRGANYVLLRLLAELLARRGARAGTAGRSLPVPMHLPPHLRGDSPEEQSYPVRLPTGALERLCGGKERELEAMTDCLTDGPPQHAVANVLMVAMLDALLDEEARKP